MFVTRNVLLYIQSGNLGDDNIDVKEEYKEEDEEYGVMEEFTEGHKNMMEPPSTRNPPERCPHPLYSWDSTQEGHTIPHHHQVGGDGCQDHKSDLTVWKYIPLLGIRLFVLTF